MVGRRRAVAVGLPFALQALAVMPVVLALAYFTAALLDALLGRVIQLIRRARRRSGAQVARMPRSHVTLVLVTLVALVIVTWLLTH